MTNQAPANTTSAASSRDAARGESKAKWSQIPHAMQGDAARAGDPEKTA